MCSRLDPTHLMMCWQHSVKIKASSRVLNICVWPQLFPKLAHDSSSPFRCLFPWLLNEAIVLISGSPPGLHIRIIRGDLKKSSCPSHILDQLNLISGAERLRFTHVYIMLPWLFQNAAKVENVSSELNDPLDFIARCKCSSEDLQPLININVH